jgi:hypothetical protein
MPEGKAWVAGKLAPAAGSSPLEGVFGPRLNHCNIFGGSLINDCDLLLETN